MSSLCSGLGRHTLAVPSGGARVAGQPCTARVLAGGHRVLLILHQPCRDPHLRLPPYTAPPTTPLRSCPQPRPQPTLRPCPQPRPSHHLRPRPWPAAPRLPEADTTAPWPRRLARTQGWWMVDATSLRPGRNRVLRVTSGSLPTGLLGSESRVCGRSLARQGQASSEPGSSAPRRFPPTPGHHSALQGEAFQKVLPGTHAAVTQSREWVWGRRGTGAWTRLRVMPRGEGRSPAWVDPADPGFTGQEDPSAWVPWRRGCPGSVGCYHLGQFHPPLLRAEGALWAGEASSRWGRCMRPPKAMTRARLWRAARWPGLRWGGQNRPSAIESSVIKQ